jgi:catechol 2,3-dioxygenase-like lactoylglutathione lyase family enzyme
VQYRSNEDLSLKITANLFVDEIEKSLEFWVGRMGFEQTVGVPDGDRPAFVILVRDGAELMMQTLESLRKDEPGFAPEKVGAGGGLFIEVGDFEDVLKRLEGYPIAMKERTTFYGMREIGVRDPSGHIAIFAAPSTPPADAA